MEIGQGSSSKVIDTQTPNPSEICAVIITYFPDAGVPERVRLIAEQVGQVLVVDNGSGSSYKELLLHLSIIRNVSILLNDANRGLATALNQGVCWAKDNGFGWALLFDQDSTPLEAMVEEFAQICQELGQDARTTLIGSNFIDVNSGRTWLSPPVSPSHVWTEPKTMTTSGTLVPLSVFDALGPFRSDLFVDLVDMEYGLRARSRGYKLVASVRPLMLHTVGSKKQRRFLWRTVWPSYHPPLRRYFMARNTVWLIREYGTRDRAWALTAVSALVKSVILVLCYEDRRLSKLSFTARGISAGLRRSSIFDSTERLKVAVESDAPRLPL
jgi:rhamnosyltransferase